MNPLLWLVDRFLRGWSAVQAWAGIQGAFPWITPGQFARLHTAADTGIWHGRLQTQGGTDFQIPYGDLAVDSTIRRGGVQYNIRATWVATDYGDGELVERHVYSTALTVEAAGTLMGADLYAAVAGLAAAIDDIPYDLSDTSLIWRVESVFRGAMR